MQKTEKLIKAAPLRMELRPASEMPLAHQAAGLKRFAITHLTYIRHELTLFFAR